MSVGHFSIVRVALFISGIQTKPQAIVAGVSTVDQTELHKSADICGKKPEVLWFSFVTGIVLGWLCCTYSNGHMKREEKSLDHK